MALLELSHVDTYYDDSHILFDLSLTVEAGEVVCLLGRNGAGKTTTVRSIVGLTPPRGRPHHAARSRPGRAAAVPHRPAGHRLRARGPARLLQPHRAGKPGGGAARPGATAAASAWTAERVYELFPILRERRRQAGGTLSGGEQQMLTIARTLMGNPDRPAARRAVRGAGAAGSGNLRQQLGRLKASGLTIVLAEQNVRFVSELGDRVYILEKGMVRYQGSMAEFLADEQVRQAYLAV